MLGSGLTWSKRKMTCLEVYKPGENIFFETSQLDTTFQYFRTSKIWYRAPRSSHIFASQRNKSKDESINTTKKKQFISHDIAPNQNQKINLN